MAYSFLPTASPSITLAEFVDYADRTIRGAEAESVLDCVGPLQQLASNQNFLSELLNQKLSNFLAFQKLNSYSAQTLILHATPEYYIRVNAWPVVKQAAIKTARAMDKQGQDLFFFLRAHDHNFSFLTVGYLGAGYTTEIWEYDYNSVIGYTGEKVDLRYLETTTLPEGKAMYYTASRDIHIQHPPEEYSISINVIPSSNQSLEREQFYFDMEKREISGIVPTGGSGRHLLFELCEQCADARTIGLLTDLAKAHELPQMRVRAYASLAGLSAEPDYIWQQALQDTHASVRGRARLVLDQLQTT